MEIVHKNSEEMSAPDLVQVLICTHIIAAMTVVTSSSFRDSPKTVFLDYGQFWKEQNKQIQQLSQLGCRAGMMLIMYPSSPYSGNKHQGVD